MTEERIAELIAENVELRQRRDELLRENNRLVEERRALVGLSHVEFQDLARVAYDAHTHASSEPGATDWARIGYFQRQVWDSTMCAVVAAARATIRAQERQAIIDLLGGGE